MQYKFVYIDHLKVPKKVELEFGSLMHKIVENALKKEPIVPQIKESQELYNAGFKEILFKNPKQKKQYYAVGQEIIKSFYNTLTPGLRDTIATEKRFYFPLDEKHDLMGVIDRIDKLPYGAYEVIDYKTNFKPKTQIELDKDKQMGIYQLAINMLWPEAEDILLSMYFLKPNLKLTTRRTQDDLEILKNEIISTAEEIEKAKEFLPKPNPLCDWCDFQHLCPLKKDKLTESEINIDDVIAEYALLIKKSKELEEKIHKHFDSKKIESLESKDAIVIRTKDKKISLNNKN